MVNIKWRNKKCNENAKKRNFLKKEIDSMQGWTATTRHGVAKKKKKETQKDQIIQDISLEGTYS